MISGHDFIDILKIDIEGAEFGALSSLFAAYADMTLPFGQLQLEIHTRGDHERVDQFTRWWETLESAGLRPFYSEPNLVYISLFRGGAPRLAEVRQ